MMTNTELLLTVLIVAAVTLATRAVSFLLFPTGKQAPKFITWLSGQLPRAVMAMLLVYCLKDVSFGGISGYLPAFLAVLVTAALHLWKKQMMLSIVGGTALYMLLIRVLA